MNIDPDKAARIAVALDAIADNPRKPQLLREAAHEAIGKLRAKKFAIDRSLAPLNAERCGSV
mgnify:CR=1 FL=1